MKRIVLLILVAGLALATRSHADSICYVQSVKAKVMSDASFKSAVIAEIIRGFKLVSTGKEGNWVKVRFKNKDGYISSLLVSTHPPLDKAGIIKGEEAEIRQGVRRRASSYTSAAAARGLTQDDRKRLNTEETADYASLEKVESFKLSDDELSRFTGRTK
jgi:hypothetical protein